MPIERDVLRDWHRLFGLLLTDFFTDSPFVVEVERDLSQQQQLLDVVIVRKRRGRFRGRLPDGLAELADHNLITFKSHHEALDDWAVRELVAHFVAYRKFVSPTPSELLPSEHFRLFAVAARFPQALAGLVPWRERQPGVYDCRWGLDDVRVIVAGQLPREAQNAPLHLFSASPELVGFGGSTYQQHSEYTSALLRQLFERFQVEGVTMAWTMKDFRNQFVKEHFVQLTPAEQQEALRLLSREKQQELLNALPPEERLAGLSPEQIQAYLDQLAKRRSAAPQKRHRKK